MADTSYYYLPAGLSDLEVRVLNHHLADQDESTQNSLLGMLACARCESQDYTGVGFFRGFGSIPGCHPARSLPDGMYTIGFAFDPGDLTQVEFMLCVEGGVLKYLEAVTFSGNWPAEEYKLVLGLPSNPLQGS